MRALKGNVTRTGYRRDSKDRFNDFNVIPSNKISMKGVDHDVIGVSDRGDVKHMKPGGEYRFSGKTVTEFPVYQGSGQFNIPKEAYNAQMDTTAFIRALAGVESDLNYRAQNPTSSAVGGHQFLWNLLKKDPNLSGVTKEQYMFDEDLQNETMRRALTESVAGGNPYMKDIADIREEYSPQIPGFDDMFSDLDLLLMRHLKGRQGSREYLGHTIRDGRDENLKGKNMTFPDYQAKFYRYYYND